MVGGIVGRRTLPSGVLSNLLLFNRSFACVTPTTLCRHFSSKNRPPKYNNHGSRSGPPPPTDYNNNRDRDYPPYRNNRDRDYPPYRNNRDRDYPPYKNNRDRDYPPFKTNRDRDYPPYRDHDSPSKPSRRRRRSPSPFSSISSYNQANDPQEFLSTPTTQESFEDITTDNENTETDYTNTETDNTNAEAYDTNMETDNTHTETENTNDTTSTQYTDNFAQTESTQHVQFEPVQNEMTYSQDTQNPPNPLYPLYPPNTPNPPYSTNSPNPPYSTNSPYTPNPPYTHNAQLGTDAQRTQYPVSNLPPVNFQRPYTDFSRNSLSEIELTCFTDPSDLEPIICRYMFSVNMDYFQYLNFGEVERLQNHIDLSKGQKNCRLISFLSPQESKLFHPNFFTPCIIAFVKNFNEYPRSGNEDIFITKENLVMNPGFRNLLWNVFKQYSIHDPDVQDFGRIIGTGYIPLIDYRSPLEDDKIEPENVIGVVEARDGKLVEDSFIANRDHSFFHDELGWTALTQFMYQKVTEELHKNTPI